MLERKHKQPALLAGVLLLTVANMTVKVIGLLFKVPLSYLLGDEGMGYFNAAYSIYSWLYIVATAGLPVAVSILISDAAERGRNRRVERIFRVAMAVFLMIGAIGFFLMFAFASPLSRTIGNGGSRYAIAAVAPTLFFICVAGGIRGYFQGQKEMLPTAISQIIEAAGKLVLGILFGTLALRQGKPIPIVAAYAILGVTVGTAAGALYLLICTTIDRRRKGRNRAFEIEDDTTGILGPLFRIALPITLSSAVMSLTNLIDLGFIMNRLRSGGFSESQAATLFGNYTTLAVPLFHLPSVLIYPVASSVVPYISAALATGNRQGVRSLMATALRFTSVLSLPCAAGLALFSARILSLFFRAESAALAAPALSVLAPGVFFSAIVAVTNAILQANGRAALTVWSMCTGAALKMLIGYIMIGNPTFGIYGAAVGTVACYAAAAVMNLAFIGKTFGYLPSFASLFSKPFASTAAALLLSLCLGRLLLPILPDKLMTLFLIAATAVLYALFLFLFGAVHADDLGKIPKGELFVRLFRRIKLIR